MYNGVWSHCNPFGFLILLGFGDTHVSVPSMFFSQWSWYLNRGYVRFSSLNHQVMELVALCQSFFVTPMWLNKMLLYTHLPICHPYSSWQQDIKYPIRVWWAPKITTTRRLLYNFQQLKCRYNYSTNWFQAKFLEFPVFISQIFETAFRLLVALFIFFGPVFKTSKQNNNDFTHVVKYNFS